MFVSIFHSLGNAFTSPLLQALLSREADAKSQGSIMGINASYQSIGMIVGPVLGGLIATYSIPLPFMGGAAVMVVCALISYYIMKHPIKKEVLI
jgi:DHA1 family multidrug resistance protein-like MFS transporter